MVKVSDDMWALLAKSLFDEAGPEDCLLAQEILRNDAGLRAFYQQMQSVHLWRDIPEPCEASEAFLKLDSRIKSESDKTQNDL